MENKKVLYADLALILVAIIWGSGFVVTKNALNLITPFYLIFYRFSISAVLLGIFSYKKLLKASKKDIKAGIIIGIFLFGGFSFQTIGLQYIEAGKQAFITATYVVMVPFIYWAISKKKPNKIEVFAAFLCLIGIGILSLERNLSMGLGELLSLICAIMFALHVSSTGYFAAKSDPYVISVIQFGTTAVLSLFLALLFEERNVAIDSGAIIPILYLAILASMLAFLIQTIAQRHTSSTHTAIILSSEALFGSILGVLILSEPVTLKFIIGSIIILISIISSETKLDFSKLKKTYKKIK